jgi:signal transduction histidine kinase
MRFIRLFFLSLCLIATINQNNLKACAVGSSIIIEKNCNIELHKNISHVFLSCFNQNEANTLFLINSNRPWNRLEITQFLMQQGLIFYLVVSILFLLIILIAFLIWSRHKALVTSRILAENNDFIADLYEEIRQQFDLIKEKNKELDKYQYHLEMLVEERTREMQAAKNKAKESDTFKSSLLSNIYHEIRTPLNAIIGFSQLLGFEEDIKHKEYLKIIDKNADDLLVFVDNIIELSKIQSENQSYELERIGLKEFMNKLFMETCLLRDSHKKEEIEIFPDFHDLSENDYLITNRQILEKTLNQLANNALKYTTKGIVGLSCKQTNKFVVFDVSDTGKGIEKEKLPLIFNPFHKVTDQNHTHRGLGIGLAIAKHFSQRLNGQLIVESEINKGTKFSLILPSSN